MPYPLPNFNILCNVYTFDPLAPTWPAIPTAGPRISNLPCALVYGRRVNVASTGGTSSVGLLAFGMSLLTSKLSDLRGLQDTTGQDVVECPAGSGRWYAAMTVDDISKGYYSEHRTTLLQALAGTWSPPYS